MSALAILKPYVFYVPFTYIATEWGCQYVNEEEIARRCCDIFGGCTVTEGNGYWNNDKGKTEEESVFIFTCYGLDTVGLRSRFLELVIRYGVTFEQSAMLLSVAGEGFMIPAERYQEAAEEARKGIAAAEAMETMPVAAE